MIIKKGVWIKERERDVQGRTPFMKREWSGDLEEEEKKKQQRKKAWALKENQTGVVSRETKKLFHE